LDHVIVSLILPCTQLQRAITLSFANNNNHGHDICPALGDFTLYGRAQVTTASESMAIVAVANNYGGVPRYDNVRVAIQDPCPFAQVYAILHFESTTAEDATFVFVRWYENHSFPRAHVSQYAVGKSCGTCPYYVRPAPTIALGSWDLLAISTVHDHCYVCPDFDNYGAYFIARLYRDQS
jgi:hypothetical protein